MNDILTMRTELANDFAVAGAKLLNFTATAGALAAIPETEPQQYVVAGTLESIEKVLPTAATPARRKDDRHPTEPLVFEDEPTPAATSGDAPTDLQQLKALALAATPGKWIDAGVAVYSDVQEDCLAVTHFPGMHRSVVKPQRARNAAFIAAANPAAVLDLIALARRAAAPHAEPEQASRFNEQIFRTMVATWTHNFPGWSEDDAIADRRDAYWRSIIDYIATHPAAPVLPAVGGALVAKTEPDMGEVWRAIDTAMPALSEHHCAALHALSKADKETFTRAIIRADRATPTESAAAPADLIERLRQAVQYKDIIDHNDVLALLEYVATSPAAAPAGLEQALIEKRIELTPEYEGEWRANVYLDSDEPRATAAGPTPSAAVDAALLRLDRATQPTGNAEQGEGA